MTWKLAPLLGPLGSAVALVTLAGWVWLGVRGARAARPAARAAVALLRGAAALCVAWILLGPSELLQRERQEAEPCVILVDRSRSMDLGSRWEQAMAALQNRLTGCAAADRGLSPLVFSYAAGLDPGPIDTAGPGRPDGEGSDLFNALTALRPALDGRRPASVAVISDTADLGALGRAARSGRADEMRELLQPFEHPVDVVLVGSEEGIDDLRISGVDAPGFAFVHRPLRLRVHVERRGRGPDRVEVRLRIDGSDHSRVELDLGREGTAVTELEIIPEVLGTMDVDLRLVQSKPDDLPGNDRRLLRIRVLRDRLRVLQLAGRPTWDVKFVRRLLKTDPNIDLVSFFIMRDRPETGGLIGGQRELSLIEFPYRDLFGQDLASFDLFIMQNFDLPVIARERPGPYMQRVLERVEAGMGLVLTGGDQAFGNSSWQSGPLASLMPMLGGASYTDLPFRLRPASQALSHPVLRLRSQPEANLSAWENLPELSGRHAGFSLQSGALGLLETQEGEPVLSVLRHGEGRVVALGTDALWQWAMDPGSASDYRRLWSNILEWTVHERGNDRLHLSVDPLNARPGEPLSVLLRCLDGQDGPEGDRPVELRLLAEGADGSTAAPLPDGRCDSAGLYQTELESPGPGLWRLRARRPDLAAASYHSWIEERFVVHDDSVEWERPDPIPELAERTTRITDGKRFSPDSAAPPSLAPPMPPSLVGQERRALWDRGPLLALLCLFLGGEWILRRRSGAA
jgi:hypothetical protein